ncbi:MAG: winged helix-turn-helix domain-containing protein, partial [Candidatus Baltobacteraceae bacterium]
MPMTHDRTRRSGAHPAVAEVSALIGDRGRAAMLCALLDGEKLSAGELARCAELAPNAASAHLAKLIAGGLLVVKASGRQRFYTLASVNVARAMEALAVISRPAKILALSQSYIAEDLRSARSCYDHLAGRLGVAVTESLVEKRMLVPDAGASYAVSAIGDEFFSSLGIDLNKSRR